MNADDKKIIDRAIDKRTRLFDSLDRMERFIINITDQTKVEEIVVRLETLNDVMLEFRKIEDKIMSYADQISEIIEFENRFFSAKATLQRHINQRNGNTTDINEQLRQTVNQLTLNQTTFLETFKSANSNSSDIRLPKLKIPSFGGQYEEFPAFKDLYESSIHNNASLSNALKFQFLKGVLHDDAASLIKHIKCTSANYEEAWSKIVDRYDKRKQVVSKYIQLFLDISAITKSNQINLRSIYNTADEAIRGLRALGVEAEERDPWLINILLSKLDPETRQLWAHKTLHNDFPKFESCLKFVGERCDTLENSESILTASVSSKLNSARVKIASHHVVNSSAVKRTPKCQLCQDYHSLFKCQKFKAMHIPERREFVLKNNICFNCLTVGHSSKTCRSQFSCHYCKGRHHSALHLSSTPTTTLTIGVQDQTTSQSHTVQQQPTTLQIDTNIAKKVSLLAESSKLNMDQCTGSEHLLPTAVVNISNIHGEFLQCRILLDSGSMGNLISQSLIKRLQLPQTKSNTIVSGVASNTTSRWKSTVTISSHIDPKRLLTIDVHILPTLSSLPIQSFTKLQLHQLENSTLADPNYNIKGPIDIILNAGTVFSVLLSGNFKLPNCSVTAQNTIFGWVLGGDTSNLTEFSECISSNSTLCSMHTSCLDIDQTLQKFWQSEEISSSVKLTPSELKCEEIFKKTVRRDSTGRYIVTLPFAEIQKPLGNSLRSAVSRLLSIEKKLEKSAQLHDEYHSFMSEYLSLNHMEKIPPEEININTPAEHFYLPHHFVIKNDSCSTKLRVVFDGSCSSSSGVSLNQNLLVGPRIQEDLTIIIMRFRMNNIAFCADIEKMFRQVLVDPSQRDYQRIVWRFNPTAEIEHFRLNTITYGTASAPFLATRTIHQLAQDNKSIHPLAAKTVARDFYVDDLLTGTSTVQEALNLQAQVVKLLDSGGFTLRKWSSNSSTFMNHINQSDCKESIPIFKLENDTIKVLGLHWQPEIDNFVYKVQSYSPDTILTKRKFLSQASKLFDPFGWLSPVLINIKILFQELWLFNLTWDDPLPTQFTEKWENIKLNLKRLEKLKISRQILFNKDKIQLHGFSDASEVASAAVIYCRSYDSNGYPRVKLITAKTKVAPVRTISIPRLELNGALLLSRLFSQVQQAFVDYEVERWAWCDSEIVLAWLSSHPNRWKTYVANRTSEILDQLPRKLWRHVDSKDNPADLASRGIQPADLIENEFWFSGPSWLSNNAAMWPSTIKESLLTTELEKKKPVLHVHTTTKVTNSVEDLLNQISSWTKLRRIIAFCKRFIHNCQPSTLKRNGQLTADELKTAEKICIKFSQKACFSSEINELTKQKFLKGKSHLLTLAPFLDSENILRVGGRLHNSAGAYDSKHPIILHHSHILSKLIVSHQHIFFLHPSPSLLSSLLRNKYWIVGSSYLIKRESHNCTKCVRYRRSTSKQLMGTLPQPRVLQSKPFSHTGIDYAGPIMLQSKKGRGAKLIKAYICVFVCLSIKAIHLEVVSDLSSEAFIASFKRFVSRRGLPSDVYTDNGTNFVGAYKKFKAIFSMTELTRNYENIQLFCAERGINWHFSPPSAPHFGGVWEAAVKSMKTHLCIVTGRVKLTFEEMCTLVTEIECILNSRPLCSQFTDDINSLEVITPGHFLVMGPLTAVPEASYENIPSNRLKRWQQVQQQVNTFWTKYHKEYLNTLQQRNKWKTETNNLTVGDLVLIKDTLPVAHWALARIINVHPGHDERVRVVTLKTQNGILKRPIHKLVKLPVE